MDGAGNVVDPRHSWVVPARKFDDFMLRRGLCLHLGRRPVDDFRRVTGEARSRDRPAFQI